LALEADGVGVLQPVGQRAGCEGAGAVGAVAVDERARVDDHGLARLNLTVGWPAVRERPVRASGNDGLESRAFRAVLVEELDQHRRVRAREAGEVADVRRSRDEEGLFEALAQADDSLVHARPWARNSSACRYPSGPLPITRSVAISSSTDWRRHRSRWVMSE